MSYLVQLIYYIQYTMPKKRKSKKRKSKRENLKGKLNFAFLKSILI